MAAPAAALPDLLAGYLMTWGSVASVPSCFRSTAMSTSRPLASWAKDGGLQHGLTWLMIAPTIALRWDSDSLGAVPREDPSDAVVEACVSLRLLRAGASLLRSAEILEGSKLRLGSAASVRDDGFFA